MFFQILFVSLTFLNLYYDHFHYKYSPHLVQLIHLFLVGDFVFCPYPTSCIYDRYKDTGVHSCRMPVCQFKVTAEAMLRHEIELLSRIVHKTKEQKSALEKLKKKCEEEFPSEKRGGGHAPPD